MAAKPHTVQGADRTVDSVDVSPLPTVNASQRAGAPRRVPTGDVPESDAAEGAAEVAGGRIGRLCSWLMAGVHPPDIWGDRPGVAKLAAYARHGGGAPADGPLRTGQIWWFRLVCLPITAWAYWKAWALERPMRGVPVLIVQVWWWLLNMAVFLHLL
ncbi:hypothetical protein D0T12_18395 [Actinomadura spongiicola]|uniref:Uncharacterized protein n=1 Tax=Actinomadura spongiicola TaxID=2303421 RepID=A0A372GFK4_9ACTN|nr:hypothetical protein [Actinomadura spongiicola]RFS84130.1 hypothetical protein D0T12_18395 [Actinomadura spongiicola]